MNDWSSLHIGDIRAVDDAVWNGDTWVLPQTMTAAEKAMQDIGAALESFYRGSTTSDDLCDTVAQVNGAYSVERIGEGE